MVTLQDEKDCREIGKVHDEITNLSRAIIRAKRRNDFSYVDILKDEIVIRQKRLEKLREF